MSKFRRIVLWIALILIVLLIFLSIYGAFLGAERAKDFFNSLPLFFYWLSFTALLIVAFAVFRGWGILPRKSLAGSPSHPGLLLMHLGCIFILAGAMCGSNNGHKLQKQLFGIDKIPTANMVIYEGYSENHVTLENDQQSKELPFSIRLKNFQIKYYQPEYLLIQTFQDQAWKIPVEVGREFFLDQDVGTVTILKTFENFKIKIEDDLTMAYDDPQPGSNPALQVQIKHSDGTVTTRYVFERFPGHAHPKDKLLLSYRRIISDYVSDLQVIKDGQVVAAKSIEVNHPLHFGGYHFYQHSYDAEEGQYTVLMVVSDTGLFLVYAGYLMLTAGVFWRFWLRHIFTRIRKRINAVMSLRGPELVDGP